MQKLDEYFDLSKKKQKEKREKLLQIIARLEQKKSEIKAVMVMESEKDETSEEFYNLDKELIVIKKLLKKAKQHNPPEEEI